ncbi:YrhC family protein [Bacillus alkalicellulosilyticus]|uniref:YrhC family protein n=1 Tax=Alkalihalobacterium alkalicellulosilyticum TaxID=1912214 RepID=UPI0009970C62|nr:YrhC family protein [Bacillus alkalicellulosilyticus]
MDEKQLQTLKDKVVDYRRYAYILLSISIFLFIGLLIPNETTLGPEYMVAVVFIMLFTAVVFNRRATICQNKINEEE